MADQNYNTLSQAQVYNADQNRIKLEAEQRKQEQERENTKLREDIQYTLFVSGLRHGRYSELEKINKVDNLGLIFDSVERHTYTKTYSKTSYAVESKSKGSDNVVTEDGKFSFTGRVTDSPYIIDTRNYIDRDTDKEKPIESKRPSKAIDFIRRIADAHLIVTLVTEDTILENYVITSFSADRSTDEGSSVLLTLELEEFRFKNITKTVLAKTADPKKAGKKNSGTKQTAEGGAVDDTAKKKKSPYLGKTRENFESWETSTVGTTDFSGAPGAKIKPTGPGFDPSSILRK